MQNVQWPWGPRDRIGRWTFAVGEWCIIQNHLHRPLPLAYCSMMKCCADQPSSGVDKDLVLRPQPTTTLGQFPNCTLQWCLAVVIDVGLDVSSSHKLPSSPQAHVRSTQNSGVACWWSPCLCAALTSTSKKIYLMNFTATTLWRVLSSQCCRQHEMRRRLLILSNGIHIYNASRSQEPVSPRPRVSPPQWLWQWPPAVWVYENCLHKVHKNIIYHPTMNPK